MKTSFKYKAFISYNSKDNCTARWLQRRLESYNLPSLIVNEKGDVLRSYDKKPKHFKIFRYVTDLVAQNLDDGLQRELDQSEYLIVISSPNSANAPWVKREVSRFIETGRKKQIIPFVIDGIPYSGGDTECFTQELKDAFPHGSALGVNLKDRGDDFWFFRRPKAVAKMVSLLLDLPSAFDFIWNRYRLRIIYQAVACVITMTIFLLSLIAIKEFDAAIHFKEVYVTDDLPKYSGELKVKIGSEVRSYEIREGQETLVLTDIPGKYFRDEIHLEFAAQAYSSIDTTIVLEKVNTLNISRDPAFYGNVTFILYDVKKGKALPFCPILIQGKEFVSDANGVVRGFFDLSEQSNEYIVSSSDECRLQVISSVITPPFGMSNVVEVIKY